MIEGVTIIETITQTVDKLEFSWVVITVLVALSLLVGIEAISNLRDKKILEGFLCLLVVVVSLLLGLYNTGVFVNNQQTETLYIVQIDDNVSVKEFCEKYEIVSIDGDKYTVRLRN